MKASSAGTQTRRRLLRPSSRPRSTSRSAIPHSSTTCALEMVGFCVMELAIILVDERSRGATSCASDGMMCAAGSLRYARLGFLKFIYRERTRIGRHSHRHRTLASVPNPRRSPYRRIQSHQRGNRRTGGVRRGRFSDGSGRLQVRVAVTHPGASVARCVGLSPLSRPPRQLRSSVDIGQTASRMNNLRVMGTSGLWGLLDQ